MNRLWERSSKNKLSTQESGDNTWSSAYWMDDEPTSIYRSGLVKIEYLSWKGQFPKKFLPALKQEYQRTVSDAAALTTFPTQFVPFISKQFTWW